MSSLSPGLQVTVDLDVLVVGDITITLDPDSDTGILLDNAGFNTTLPFVVTDPVSGLTPTDLGTLWRIKTKQSRSWERLPV